MAEYKKKGPKPRCSGPPAPSRAYQEVDLPVGEVLGHPDGPDECGVFGAPAHGVEPRLLHDPPALQPPPPEGLEAVQRPRMGVVMDQLIGLVVIAQLAPLGLKLGQHRRGAAGHTCEALDGGDVGGGGVEASGHGQVSFFVVGYSSKQGQKKIRPRPKAFALRLTEVLCRFD